MKRLSEVKKRLQFNYQARKFNKRFITNEKTLDDIKIIGITGSSGKSTCAYLVHEYLKYIGKKSVLYSSLGVDSPISFKAFAPLENPLYNEEMLFDIISEGENYGADYVVMEVNERAIRKNLVKDIPFAVRALTNLIPNHDYFLGEKLYFETKMSFFRDLDDNDCSVFGLTRFMPEKIMRELLEITKNKKILFGSKYLINYRGFNPKDFDFVLNSEQNNFLSLEGLDLRISHKDSILALKSKLILAQHSENILCVISILKALKEFNYESFGNFLKNVTVSGREETIHFAKRTVIISNNISPQLEELKIIPNKTLKVIAGAKGAFYKSFIKENSDEEIINEKIVSIDWAFNYLDRYADFVYLTTNDTGSFKPDDFLKLQAEKLKNCPYEIIKDRKKAIEKAIMESEEEDIIYVSGRGNKLKFLKSFTEMEVFTDKEIVEEAIKSFNERREKQCQ